MLLEWWTKSMQFIKKLFSVYIIARSNGPFRIMGHIWRSKIARYLKHFFQKNFFFKKISKRFSKILKNFEDCRLKMQKKSIFRENWWVTKTNWGHLLPSPKPPGGKNRKRPPATSLLWTISWRNAKFKKVIKLISWKYKIKCESESYNKFYLIGSLLC